MSDGIIEEYYEFKHKRGSSTITVRSSHEEIGDVVEEFKTFLLAVGFHPDSVEQHLGPE